MKNRYLLFFALAVFSPLSRAEIVTAHYILDVFSATERVGDENGPSNNIHPGDKVEYSYTIDTSIEGFVNNDNTSVYPGALVEFTAFFPASGLLITFGAGRVLIDNNLTFLEPPFFADAMRLESFNVEADGLGHGRKFGSVIFYSGRENPDMLSSSELPEEKFENFRYGAFGVQSEQYALSIFAQPVVDSDADGISDFLDACPASYLGGTVVMRGVDSGVENRVQQGCSLTDLIVEQCAAALAPHGRFVSCVAGATGSLRKDNLLSGREAGAIRSAAARSR